MARFGIVFAVCFVTGVGLLLLPPVQRIDVDFSCGLVRISQAVISLAGGSAKVQGAVLRAPSGFGIEMKDGCNGINVLILLWAALLAFPAPWKIRAVGLAAGSLAIQFVNILRFISLFYLGQFNLRWFEFAHVYLWETLLILDALVVFWLWVGRVSRSAKVAGATA